ncbi:MAG: hypothetical protein R3A79_06715 [Nannocystaceae bacterium]
MAAASPRIPVRRVVFGVAGLSLALAGALACKAAPRDLVGPQEAAAGAEVDAGADEAQAVGGLDLVGDVEEEAEMTRGGDDLDDGLADDLAAYERLLVEQELRLRSAGVALDGAVAQAEAVGGATRGDSVSPAPASPPSSPASPTTTSKSAASKSPSKKKSKAPKRPGAGAGAGAGGGRGAAPQAEPNEEIDRCAVVCDLAATTCDLQGRICDLASRHPGEDRYAQVCARATSDCERARLACEDCPV